MHLKDYIKIYNTFTEQECETILNSVNNEWKKHRWYDHKLEDNSGVHEHEEDLSINYLDEFQAKLVCDKISEKLINNYFKESDPYVQDITVPRINRYKPHEYMRSHSDHIKSIFDGERRGIPILSIVTLLNDEFTGGELLFNLYNSNEKISFNLNKGDIIVWPSVFLYLHEVTPVISGTRYSLVNWAY